MQLSIGTTITSPQNSYVIESVLGHGTFGITYTIKIISGKNKGKILALKEFFINGISSREESGNVSSRSDTISTEQCKAEFIAEAQNLIALNHPNIVKAHEVFEANGTVYYTMDYIKGENLNSYLKHNKLTVDEAVNIITKIAYALSYMHESQHMLHLDLKPGNVMRRASDGQIILIDFGLSRYFTEKDMPEGEAPIGLGTKGYAPVEQADFKNRKGNFKATIDVYALGATFFKLITGESPIPSRMLMEQPQLLRRKLQSCGLPEQKIQFIEKAMNPSPEKRYQSVMEFIYDINAEERKRKKRNWVYSGLILISVVILSYVIFDFLTKNPIQNAYHKTDCIFELHEGGVWEAGYFKFFNNGNGLYMHELYEGRDHKLSSIDTISFKYAYSDNTIQFPRDPMSKDTQMVTISIDTENQDIIYIGDNDYDALYLVDESTDWNEIIKLVN